MGFRFGATRCTSAQLRARATERVFTQAQSRARTRCQRAHSHATCNNNHTRNICPCVNAFRRYDVHMHIDGTGDGMDKYADMRPRRGRTTGSADVNRRAAEGYARAALADLGTNGVLPLTRGYIAYAYDARARVFNTTRVGTGRVLIRTLMRAPLDERHERATLRAPMHDAQGTGDVRSYTFDAWDGTRRPSRLRALLKRDATADARRSETAQRKATADAIARGYRAHVCPKDAPSKRVPPRARYAEGITVAPVCKRAHATPMLEAACKRANARIAPRETSAAFFARIDARIAARDV